MYAYEEMSYIAQRPYHIEAF